MKVKVESQFLRAEDVSTGDFLEFTDGGKSEYSERFGKDQFTVGVKLGDGTTKKLSLNNTSLKNMIAWYGDETEKWVGKEARIQVETQVIRGERKKIIFLTSPNKDMDGNLIIE